MNSLKPAFTPFHAPAGLRRLLVVVLAVLLLGVLTAIPALASGSGTWTLTGSLNTVREGATMTRLQNGQVLVAGGVDNSFNILASAELYNPATGQWTLTGSLNASRDGAAATLLPNGKVLVAGGGSYDDNFNFVSLTSAELYNPATGTWTLTGSLNVARQDAPTTLLTGGQVLIAGGASSSGCCPSALASAELYTP